MEVDPISKTPITMVINVSKLMVDGATSEAFSGQRTPLKPHIGKSSGAFSTLVALQPPEDKITEEGTERERSSVLMQVNSLVVPNQPSQVADQYAKVSPFID